MLAYSLAWLGGAYATLVYSALGSGLILLVATAAVLATGEPARRIRIIQWAMAGAILVPILALVPGYPRWSPWRMLPSGSPEMAEPVLEPEFAALQSDDEPAVRVFGEESEKAAPLPLEESPEISQPSETFLAPSRSALDFRAWVALAYLAGVAALAAWSFVGLLAMWRLLRRARTADDALRRLLTEIAGPASAGVRLLVSARADQPCALGWLRPTIVLPEALVAQRNPQRQRWALVHEWSHVARGDVWAWSLAGVVRWFYYYQPLVWYLRWQLQLCQDYLADARASGAGQVPEDYAEFLTSSCRHSRLALPTGLGIGGRPSDLQRRIVMLVENQSPPQDHVPRRWNWSVVFAATAIIAASSCLREQEIDSAAEPGYSALLREGQGAGRGEPDSIQPGDVLNVEVDVAGAESTPPLVAVVEPSGKIPLGARLGRVLVKGLTLEEAEAAVVKQVSLTYGEPRVQITYRSRAHDSEPGSRRSERGSAPTTSPYVDHLAQAQEDSTATRLPVSGLGPDVIQAGDVVKIEVASGGELLVGDSRNGGFWPPGPIVVESTGTIPLGARYGRVEVAGKTVSAAEAAIKEHLSQTFRDVEVQLTFERRASRDSRQAGTVWRAAPEDEELRRVATERVKTAEECYRTSKAAFDAERLSLDELLDSINKLQEARLAVANTAEDEVAALERHLAALKEVEQRIQRLYEAETKGGEANQYTRIKRERQTAEINLLKARRRATAVSGTTQNLEWHVGQEP